MILLGIERIVEYQSLFHNKRVGLITNPTGVDHQFKTTIDILYEHTNLVALFSPEHGVRGDLQAGVSLDDYIDQKTNCTVYSLYGKQKKPTARMMSQIDIMAFDIQDVGARYYTYLYTMAYAMMACKEHGKTMIVFDRPNPVNAHDVEGTILDETFRSFVGYYPIPQRYGLTIGELAQLFNTEFDINCDLIIVPMKGYKRHMNYADTGLPWVFPSPNIPTMDTPYYYLTTCLFEGTNISEGRGTTKPFKIFGSPFIDAKKLCETLESYTLPGVRFRSLYFTPTFSKHQGELCQGVELYITDSAQYQPVQTGYIILDEVRKYEEFQFLPPYKEGLNPMFDLLTGTNKIRLMNQPIEQQLQQITTDSTVFKTIKRRYQIYDDL